ncbi:hypothetical protein [Burkholderia ubonensis]|uniref:hypothetical protein n=1 Tax=Burkholderia ubonensis TaxID=101571 RepID=UPI000B01337D|nr:hypothetical protein [Burkholderia ubonensis]
MNTSFLERPAPQRTLPLPLVTLYLPDASSSEHSAWAALLSFANEGKPRPAWHGMGRRRSGDLSIAAVLALHRHAFEAEIEGRYEAATFYWDEWLHHLRKQWLRMEDWDAVARRLDCPVIADGAALRRTVSDELFLDSLIALTNGRIRQDKPKDCGRAREHAERIEALLALQQSPSAETRALRLRVTELQVESLADEGRFAEAIKKIHTLPDDAIKDTLSERLPGLEVQRALKQLSEKAPAKNVRVLKRAVKELESLRKAYPDRLDIYDYLGHIHHSLSIQLANDDSCAEALVASEKAKHFCPHHENAQAVFAQLTSRMEQVQNSAERLRTELRSSGNKQVTSAGRKLLADAKAGFAPLKAFRKSAEPGAIDTQRRAASDASLWRDIVGEPMPARPADKALAALREAVVTLYESGSVDEDALADGFAQIQVSRQDLPSIDARHVASFILRRRRQLGETAETAEESEADKNPATEPALAIAPAPAARRDRVPFMDWVTGSGDKGSRALALAAAASVVFALTVSAIEIPQRRIRDQAVTTIKNSPPSAYASIMTAAEQFLQARSFGISDPREPGVREAYAKAFLTWFSALDNPAAPSAAATIATYRKLAAHGGQS